MLEGIRTSQDGMADEVLGNIVEELRKRGTVGGFSEDIIQYFLEGMQNTADYDFKDQPKAAVQLEECSDSKGMQIVLNGRTFKYNFWRGRFHMLPQYYTFSHGLCLNNLLQVWLLGNRIYQVPPFRYINWSDELSHLVRRRKLIGGMKYLMRQVRRVAEALGIWTEDHWDMKRVNSLYTMVYGRFNFKINKRFDPLSL